MRTFLITLVASLVLSIVLWNFGLAHKIWPAHPLFATTLIAGVCASILQMILARDDAAEKRERSLPPRRN